MLLSSAAASSLLHALLLYQVVPKRHESTRWWWFRANNVLSEKGTLPFNGTPSQYHGWVTLQRSLMYEEELGKVMSGVETPPASNRGS